MRWRWLLLAAALATLAMVPFASSWTNLYTASPTMEECGQWGGSYPCAKSGGFWDEVYIPAGSTVSASVSASIFTNEDCAKTTCSAVAVAPTTAAWNGPDGTGIHHSSVVTSSGGWRVLRIDVERDYWIYGTICCWISATGCIIVSSDSPFTISGDSLCVDETVLYVQDGGGYFYVDESTGDGYSFDVFDGLSYMVTFDGAAHYFTVDGENIVYDYDACIYVYGYTCGIDTIKLYDDNWQLVDQVGQSSGYDTYEMQISSGQEYTISFYDLGIVLCYNHSFTSGGTDIRIDYDRCNWVYPPNPPAPPIPIYIWAGYDYNIVVFRDVHGNFIENSQLAIYDKSDDRYLQRWTGAADGYTLLGARFATDHDVILSLRTFDGIFTLATTYPANGSSEVGEENITTTNWTIPIKYNLNVLPVDQYGMPLFDVFCGLSEYTPLNPGAFWGMDLSDRGYVPVTNCSGFTMCDIIAEKEGYADYKVEALNWTSKSALVKDYRHNIMMEEE